MGVISNAKERVIIQVEMCTKRFGLKAYLSCSTTILMRRRHTTKDENGYFQRKPHAAQRHHQA
jgi:hypothetical protein